MKTATVLRVIASGAVCGLRTMTGPAMASRTSWPGWTRALPLLAVGELIVDKLPQTPARTEVGPLIARAVSGGFVGSLVAERAGEDRRLGAVLGAAGAVAAAYAGVAYRAAATRAKVPPVLAALVEDAMAIGSGLALGQSSG